MTWLRRNFLLIALLFLMLGLLFFQYQTTRPTDYWQLTEMEKVVQLRRMNEYPPAAYRLANYIENRPEAVAYFKLEKNFIDTFDLLTLFAVYFPPLLLPFFLLGYFEAVRTYPKLVLTLTALPVGLMTVIGHQYTRGPISLFPIIIVASIYGMMIFINRLVGKNAI